MKQNILLFKYVYSNYPSETGKWSWRAGIGRTELGVGDSYLGGPGGQTNRALAYLSGTNTYPTLYLRYPINILSLIIGTELTTHYPI